ncbi:MAG: hypothetical protein IPG59_21520 [Candidatus Melainabacteria bacterium]|nr:MAG: hypothetical protein IPG59_21520 [Candidatus Melainabacteria bacterium]
MRWLYIPDEDDPDFIAKQETISRIEKWWQDFEQFGLPLFKQDINELSNQSGPSDFTQWVVEHLHKIHPDIMWEVRKDDDNNDVFIATVEDSYFDGGIVLTMIEMAPKLDNWRFLTHRPPVPIESIPEYLKHTIGLKFPKDIRVSWEKSDINKIDLSYYSSTFTGDLRKDLMLTLKLTSVILGEEMFESWINEAEALKPASGPAQMLNSLIGKSNLVAHDISNLLEQCQKIKTEIIDSLPDKCQSEIVISPAVDEDAPLFMFNRDHDEENVPEARKSRRNFYLASQKLLIGLLAGIYFHSHCHSKMGEKFCYIETDLFFTDDGNLDFDTRDEFMKKIDVVLRENNLGCVVGYGSGNEKFYFDLALTDIEKTIPLLRKMAEKFKLPLDSWLLFYDSNLRDEWVGLYKDTKSPPRNF